MPEIDNGFGKPNPNAPAEFARLAFRIGRWRSEAKLKLAKRELQIFEAPWLGGYILDGCVIADDPMTDPAGSGDQVTWGGEKSDDRESWSEFMVIEAHRHQE